MKQIEKLYIPSFKPYEADVWLAEKINEIIDVVNNKVNELEKQLEEKENIIIELQEREE